MSSCCNLLPLRGVCCSIAYITNCADVAAKSLSLVCFLDCLNCSKDFCSGLSVICARLRMHARFVATTATAQPPSARLLSHRGGKNSVQMRQTEFNFVNDRQQKLVGAEYLPDTAPWATLIWHHGICEHSGRYTPVFTHMAEQGVAVYSFDVHGHGRSEPSASGDRALIKDWKHLVDDLYTFVGVVEQRVGGRLPASSTFLGGQSMGGLVVALALLRCQERWAGLVVFSAAMDVVWTPVLRVQAMLGNLLSLIIPRQQLVPAVEPVNLHPDPAVVQSFIDDPLICHGMVRVLTGNQLLKAMKHLAAHRQQISIPLLAVHGTKDAVTCIEEIERFTNGVSSKDLTLDKVEGGYHEMLMGDERIGSADKILAWMKERAGKDAFQATAAGDATAAATAQEHEVEAVAAGQDNTE